jgi:hypothetical protein
MQTYENPADAFEAALETGGVRAGVACMPDGAYVVCTSSTARKYGWEFLGRIHPLRKKPSVKDMLGE